MRMRHSNEARCLRSERLTRLEEVVAQTTALLHCRLNRSMRHHGLSRFCAVTVDLIVLKVVHVTQAVIVESSEACYKTLEVKIKVWQRSIKVAPNQKNKNKGVILKIKQSKDNSNSKSRNLALNAYVECTQTMAANQALQRANQAPIQALLMS